MAPGSPRRHHGLLSSARSGEAMEIRPGRDADAADAAAFIANLQDEPSSMIPYLNCGLGTITEELGKLVPPWTETARLAFQGDTLVGLAFVVIDSQQGRVWINGPWVVHEHWDSVADILIQLLLDDVVPAGIADVELCGHVDHHRLATLAERRALARSNVFVVMGLDRAQIVDWAPPNLSPLTDAHAEAVGRLHDELFPGAPWTGRQLLDKAGSQVTVLVATEAHRAAGYVAAEVQPGPEGYIHFVGVHGDHRRRGIGRTLVMAAVAEMLADPAVSRVFLSVDSTNAAAVALYRSLGFTPELAMVGFRTPAEHRRPRPEPSNYH
jgi:ribosomal-protein-alanine N-acetyltransferase